MLLTVQNVGRILDLYDLGHPEQGPTEVAARLEMGKSKAHLLMTSMAEIGLLRRVAGGRYVVGWRALGMERLVTETAPFRRVARAMAMRLARHSGEMVHVAALDSGRVVYVDRVPGARAATIPVSCVGAIRPAHCSGVGKLLLAYEEQDDVRAILTRHGMPRLTAATTCEPEALLVELDRVRQDGFAFDREEIQPGLCCVAAPIRGPGGSVLAAMSVSAPTARFEGREAELRTMIVSAADAVARRLRRGDG